jgi:uncharacterized membrane protein
MSTQPTTTPTNTNRNTTLFYLVSVVLIATFLYRMSAMATEYPRQLSRILEMVIDAGMIVGLIGVRKSGPQWLFIVALIAGIGLFGIRMHSKHSWYTGHWHYIFDGR